MKAIGVSAKRMPETVPRMDKTDFDFNFLGCIGQPWMCNSSFSPASDSTGVSSTLIGDFNLTLNRPSFWMLVGRELSMKVIALRTLPSFAGSVPELRRGDWSGGKGGSGPSSLTRRERLKRLGDETIVPEFPQGRRAYRMQTLVPSSLYMRSSLIIAAQTEPSNTQDETIVLA